MHPSNAYLRLAEGPEDLLGNELSLTRRLLTFFVALVLFSGTTLFATAALDLDHGLIGKALATTGKASHDGDDNSGPGGGDDDDDEADDNDGPGGDTNNAVTGGGASHSDDNHDGNTDSSHGQQVTDSNSDDNNNGATDSSRAQQSDDSNSDDNHDGNSDSSHGASVSMRSAATSDGRGDHTRG
jgi:hypothetical protein